MKRNSVLLASSFFCFSSVNSLHCIALLSKATLKLLVFWSSRKLTSLRGAGASALPPLTIFHSLSALQLWWQNCTHIRHRLQQSRRYCIPAQHRRAAMTHFPACCAAPLRINTFPLRAAAAVWPSQLPRRLSSRAQGLGRVTVRQHWHFFQPLLLNATSKSRVVAMVQLLPGLQAMA